MKAISLWQPYASFIAYGLKRIETRSWHTRYHGPIAIHAALRPMTWADRNEWNAVYFNLRGLPSLEELPRGAVVATATLVGCVPTGKLINEDRVSRQEEAFGDYSLGRYGWLLENIQRLDPPVPAKGMQGLWEWRRE